MTLFKGAGADNTGHVVHTLADQKMVIPPGMFNRVAQMHRKVIEAKTEVTLRK